MAGPKQVEFDGGAYCGELACQSRRVLGRPAGILASRNDKHRQARQISGDRLRERWLRAEKHRGPSDLRVTESQGGGHRCTAGIPHENDLAPSGQLLNQTDVQFVAPSQYFGIDQLALGPFRKKVNPPPDGMLPLHRITSALGATSSGKSPQSCSDPPLPWRHKMIIYRLPNRAAESPAATLPDRSLNDQARAFSAASAGEVLASMRLTAASTLVVSRGCLPSSLPFASKFPVRSHGIRSAPSIPRSNEDLTDPQTPRALAP